MGGSPFRMVLIVLLLSILYSMYGLLAKIFYYTFYTILNIVLMNWSYVFIYFVAPTALITLSVSYLLVQSMRSHTLINSIYRIQKK